MCTSGCGFSTAMSFSRFRSCASSTNWLFQNTLPSRSTAMTMFSGLVCVGRLRSFGSSSATFCTTTGMVMRKMISSTSITSTSGVVLICEFRSSSSACPTCIAMSDHLVRGVAAAEERHLHGAAEQADEGRGRADRGEERESGLQAVVDHVDRAVERHREPAVQVDLLLGHRRMVLYRDAPFLGDEAVGAVVAQGRGAVVHVLGGPELGLGLARVLHHAALLDQLDDGDVPGADRHDDQDDERAARDEVALLPERLDAVRVLDHLGARGVTRRLRLRGHHHARRRTRRRRGRRVLLGVRQQSARLAAEQPGTEDAFQLVHNTPGYSSRHTYSMRAHARVALPSTVAGWNLHSSRPARAASSRRRDPEERSILLSSTLPFSSIRKFKSTVPVSLARRDAGGYSGLSHEAACTTGAVRTGCGAGVGTKGAGAGGGVGATAVMVGACWIGTWMFTSGGGMKGGGGVSSLGGGGGGLSGCGGLISSMILVSRGGVTISTILRARPWIKA